MCHWNVNIFSTNGFWGVSLSYLFDGDAQPTLILFRVYKNRNDALSKGNDLSTALECPMFDGVERVR